MPEAQELGTGSTLTGEVDKLLDHIGLLKHKTELQELVGKSWTIKVLGFLDKDDLAATTMSLAEKKKLLASLKDAASP